MRTLKKSIWSYMYKVTFALVSVILISIMALNIANEQSRAQGTADKIFEQLLYTGSSFSLWKVTKIIFLFHQNYFSRKKFCGYRFRLHVLLLKLSTVSINSLLRRVEFIDFCGWFLHASFLSDHFFRVIHMKK